jgi:arsenite-transporting ATPase
MLPDDRRGDDPIIATLEERIARLRLFHERLTGPTTAFVFVLIPEKLPIDETARALEELEAARVPVAGLIVNQVIPDSATGAFIEARRAQESVHLARIDELYARHPRVRVPRRPADVHGLEDLAAVGAAILG